jgi:hypothetical protein
MLAPCGHLTEYEHNNGEKNQTTTFDSPQIAAELDPEMFAKPFESSARQIPGPFPRFSFEVRGDRLHLPATDDLFGDGSMNDDAVRVNRVDFRAAMPSLLLLEAARLAFSIQCLVPTSLSILLLLAAGSWMGTPTAMEAGPDGLAPFAVPVPFLWMHADARTIAVRGISAGFTPLIRLSICMVLTGLTGVAVARASGQQICADRRTGAIRSIRHALRSIRSILVSCFLFGILSGMGLIVFWLLLKITGLVSAASQPETLWNTPAWLGALVLITVAGICATGWLLSLSAIGVDCCDGPESLSRGISYTLSRFRRSCCYAVVISLMTWLLAAGCSYLLYQAAILSAQSLQSSSDEIELSGPAFQQFRCFIVESWKLSVVFSSVTITYVLLRQREDGVDLQEMTDR